jgi:polyhydroxyalkanoate synthesis repressor PhaR
MTATAGWFAVRQNRLVLTRFHSVSPRVLTANAVDRLVWAPIRVILFGAMRIIKRYSNRKLYDTTERHYVTLADVAGFVRKGDDIQVTDYVTSADLTAQTLAQIIFEEEKKTPRVGADVLRKIIQTGVTASPSM